MIIFVFLCFTILILFLVNKEIKQNKLKNVTVSLFWVFTYFYYITYFLNPLLLYLDDSLSLQIAKEPSSEYFIYSILISSVYWLFAYIGFNKVVPSTKSYTLNFEISQFRLKLLSIVAIILFYFLLDEYIIDFLVNSNRINMFEYSDGNGLKAVLKSLFIYAFFFYIVYYMYTLNTKAKEFDKVGIFIFLMLVSIMLFSTVIFGTRRNLAILVFSILFLFVMKSKGEKHFSVYLLLGVILITPFLSSIMQSIRYIIVDEFSLSIFISRVLELNQIIVSTFEGHWLALYLEKTDLKEILLGKNILEPFSNFLNYVPRFLWEEKPYNLGILEIQYYLAPDSFNIKGKPTITLPSTILVDIIYSFGLFAGLVVMYFIGSFLKYLTVLLEYQNNVVFIFVAVYIYINMFAFVRSGSAFIIGIIIPLIFMLFILKRKFVQKGVFNGKTK